MKKRIAIFMTVLVLGTGVVFSSNQAIKKAYATSYSTILLDDGTKACIDLDTKELVDLSKCSDTPPPGDTPTPSGDTMPIAFPNPLGTDSDIESILKSIIDWLIIIGAPIATGMIIFGAYQMLFAAGDPAKFKTGKMTIFYTVIGYGIILIGWGIASIIKEILNLKPVA